MVFGKIVVFDLKLTQNLKTHSNFWWTVLGDRSGCDKQNCRYSRFEAAPVVVLTANTTLRRGGIWNLAFKHHRKIWKLTENFENSRGAAEWVLIWYRQPSLSHAYGEIWPHMFLAQYGSPDLRQVQQCTTGCESGSEKFEKRKVKNKSFHSFWRSAKWNKSLHSFSRNPKWKKNAFTLFREAK